MDAFTYWHNLGVLETLRGKYPEARFALEKSRHLTLYSEATEQQLAIVTKQLQVEEPSSLSLGPRLLNEVILLGPMKLWIIALVSLIAAVLLLKKQWHAKWKLCALCVGALPALVVFYLQLTTVGFVTLKPIQIYEGPSRLFATGHALPVGAKLVGRIEDNWIKIYSQDSQVFWLQISDVTSNAGQLWGN